MPAVGSPQGVEDVVGVARNRRTSVGRLHRRSFRIDGSEAVQQALLPLNEPGATLPLGNAVEALLEKINRRIVKWLAHRTILEGICPPLHLAAKVDRAQQGGGI